MECNRDEALKAREIAEKKFNAKDVAGAMKFALKAQNLFPALDGISQMIATLEVHLSAKEVINGEKDWYGVLCVSASADDELVKKQYRKLALVLHPDKNKSVGAETAFKLVSEAWSVLSDNARRIAYDQKRDLLQRVSKTQTVSNGLQHFPNQASSNLWAPKSNACSAPSVVPTTPVKSSTFWTSCHQCKMQYEYLRVYVNRNLLCPNCHEPFLAIETGDPTNGYSSTVHWSSSQRPHASGRRNAYAHRKKSSSKKGSDYSGSAAGINKACNMANNSYDDMTKAWDERQGTSTGVEGPWGKFNISRGGSSSSMPAGNSGFSIEIPSSVIEKSGKKRSISDAMLNDCVGKELEGKASVSHENNNFNFTKSPHKERAGNSSGSRMGLKQYRELSSLDIRNMLNQKAKSLVQKKLKEWGSATSAKSSENKKVKKNQRSRASEKPSFDSRRFGSNEAAPKLVSIDVPDSDFNDFDKDRSEKSFEPDQVWAIYDDEDGMPRLYCLIQKVISLKPFKLRMSFLKSKTNSGLSSLNWVSMGFTKTSGDFRVGRYEINDHINMFSHKVRWEKGPRGVIKIFPHKGDIWALYRNWSPDWNELTPDVVIYKYDMVEVLDDYTEEQGIAIVPLVKVAGFKTVFHRHLDAKEVKRIPREELFRFSHQVPSYILTGMESVNAPKGCYELDPAASPLEFLQVNTNANGENIGETSEKQERI